MLEFVPLVGPPGACPNPHPFPLPTTHSPSPLTDKHLVHQTAIMRSLPPKNPWHVIRFGLCVASSANPPLHPPCRRPLTVPRTLAVSTHLVSLQPSEARINLERLLQVIVAATIIRCSRARKPAIVRSYARELRSLWSRP